MSKHLLLDRIFEYPVKQEAMSVDGCTYNKVNGYWEHNNDVMVMDKKFPKPTTKKHDVETGEDLKGE